MNDFLNIFYGTICEPVKTFRETTGEKPYKLPVFIIALISMFNLLINNTDLSVATIYAFVPKTISFIIYWLFFAFFIDLMAKLFKQESHYNKLITLLSFSFIPYIFFAPLKLMQGSFPVFSNFATLFLFATFVWTIILQILAISETYDIPRKNAIIILLIPYIGSILYLIWTIDFIAKMINIATF